MPKFDSYVRNVTEHIPRQMELGGDFVVNGRFYDKTNFVPTSYDLMEITSHRQMQLLQRSFDVTSIHEYTHCGYEVSDMDQNFGGTRYIIDSSDSNICYIATQSVTPYVHKIDMTTKKVIESIAVTEYVKNGMFAGQDDTYLYYTGVRDNANYYEAACIKVRKEAMNYTLLGDYYDRYAAVPRFLEFGISHITWSYTTTDDFDTRIMSFSRDTNIATTIKGYANTIAMKNNISDKSATGVRYTCTSILGAFGISAVKINVNGDGLDLDVAATLDHTAGTAPTHGTTANNYAFKIYIEGSRLIVFKTNNSRSVAFKGLSANYGWWVYDMVDDVTLTLINQGAFTDTPELQSEMVKIPNGSYGAYEYGAGVRLYKFNPITDAIEDVNTVPMPNLASWGFDSHGRMWWLQNDAQRTLNVSDQTLSMDVQIDFDQDVVYYDNTAVDANVNIGSYDYMGVRTASTLVLYINGNAVFKVNGQKTIEVTTSNLNDIVEVITIQDAGRVTISSKPKL